MDVVVVGSFVVDLVSFLPKVPKPGETLQTQKFCICYGGKGANQCVCAKRLGGDVEMIGKVGDDSFGKDYIQNFKENFVKTDHIAVSKECCTGVASVMVEETSGLNATSVHFGANNAVTIEEIMAVEDQIKNTKVLVCQLEIPQEASLTAIKLAKKHKVTTIMNPGPATADVEPELFTLPDYFVPNEQEAHVMTGVKVVTIDDAAGAFDKLFEKGCNTVIITLGENGCVYASKENRTPRHVPAKKVKAVDTTGAGDAFIGALAFYLAQRPDLELHEKIRRSVDIATISVQHVGAQSYPWKKDYPQELFS